jgi:hypothetical protein
LHRPAPRSASREDDVDDLKHLAVAAAVWFGAWLLIIAGLIVAWLITGVL